MKWETAAADHVGGRDQQQDRVEVLVSRNSDRRLLVVADGMGGHTGGALAAQAVVDTADELWRDGAAEDGGTQLLAEICRASHESINAIGADRKLSPRSTAVLLLLDGDKAHWAHVGDSRLYHFREGKLVQRSQDHSVVQMLVDIGKISEQEMGTHPDQNRLTQSLGGDGDPEPSFGEAEVADGDAFLLCSDGLWEMVEPEEMAEAISEAALGRAARRLSELAVKRAGDKSDNVSVAIARVGGSGPARAGAPRSWLAFALVGVVALIAALLVVFSFGPGTETGAPPGTGPAETGSTIPEVPGPGGEPERETGIEEGGGDRTGRAEDEDEGADDRLEERAIIPESESDSAEPDDRTQGPADREGDAEDPPPGRPDLQSGEPDQARPESEGETEAEDSAPRRGLEGDADRTVTDEDAEAEPEDRRSDPSGPLQGD